MSRALDPETAALLKAGDPLAAYQHITRALGSPDDGLLDIEILGKTHFPDPRQYVLQDGPEIGVSKLGLVQAFLVARKHLADVLSGTKHLPDDELFALTAVILLMDPEHLTAANTRKRLIQARISNSNSSDGIFSIISRELCFLDSLLTSRLHRHTKSPTLWNHRRWVVTTSYSSGLPVDAFTDITRIVFVAAERHPRNYYAWCHARFLVSSEDRSTINGNDSKTKLLPVVQRWCFQHYTDTSGWSFLYFLLSSFHSKTSNPDLVRSTFENILQLVSSLRLANESVWVFLRTLAASGLVGNEQYARFLEVCHEVLQASKVPEDQTVLRRAVDWCETYRRKNDSGGTVVMADAAASS